MTPALIVWCIARHIPLHSELWRAEIQSFARVNETAPLDPSPLFEHLSAGGKYLSNRKQTWASRADRSTRQHFDVGRAVFYPYSPILPAGVALKLSLRFMVKSIDVSKYLLPAGRRRWRVGIVGSRWNRRGRGDRVVPRRMQEWDLVLSMATFFIGGRPFPRVRWFQISYSA